MPNISDSVPSAPSSSPSTISQTVFQDPMSRLSQLTARMEEASNQLIQVASSSSEQLDRKGKILSAVKAFALVGSGVAATFLGQRLFRKKPIAE